MEIPFDLITLVHLAAAVIGIVSAIVIFYFGIKTNPANQPLGIGQLAISLGIFVSFSLVSGLIVHWPFMYRLGNAFALAFIPMPFLHVAFYTRNRHWKWYDLLHALPLAIYIVDFWDVLSMSNAEKLVLLKKDLADLNVLSQFSQSKFFGPGFHSQFRTILFSGYWIAQVLMLMQWLKPKTTMSRQSRIWKNWMMVFLGCQFFLWFPYYLTFFGLKITTTYHIFNSFSVLWLLASSLSLFFFPTLLYPRLYEPPSNAEHKPTRKGALPPAVDIKTTQTMLEIEDWVNNHQPFLKPGYSIGDLSAEMQVPVYQISKSLNACTALGFVDYFNKRRIQYCKDMLDKGEWSNLTLEAIALECGFSNRNSFTKAFQKFEGSTPSAYRQKAQRQSPERPLS